MVISDGLSHFQYKLIVFSQSTYFQQKWFDPRASQILNNTVTKATFIFYESCMTTEFLDLICTINIKTICMKRKHEQTELGARKVHVFYLNRPQIRSVKYGCRLHTYCEPSANKKCTKYNSVTILLRCIFESRSRCRPLYVYTARCI